MARLNAKTNPYAKAYMENPNRKQATSVAQVEKYLGAIRRAVAKYGSVAATKKAFNEHCAVEFVRKGGITDFIAWAPAGQRDKGVKVDAKQGVFHAVTLTRKDAVSRLVAGGKTRKEANEIAGILGLV